MRLEMEHVRRYISRKHFRMVVGLVVLVLLTTNNTIGATPWWDSSRNFRLPITVGTGFETGFETIEKPVDVNIDFTQLLKGIGQTGTFDENSVRVVEIDNVGTILNSSVPFQFDNDSNYDANTKASGTIVFIMDGITQANKNRYYHIYFNLTGETFSYPIVAPLVTITDNIVDEGQDSYKINAIDSTYYFQKGAGGFSSWNDISGKDWISYSTTSGVYRGIPNAVYALGIFHPGFNCCISNIVSQGPIKIRIKSASNNGEWESIWDIYPRYATMTMTKANNSYGYWMLYEGTPGGTLEPNTDFMIRSNGVKTYLNQSWYSDIASDEWVYFSDPNVDGIGRSLFVTHKEDDALQDMYKELSLPIGSDPMTVFGFGRSDSPVAGLLNSVPQHFTIGLINGTDFAQNSKIIRSAYKDLNIIQNSVEQYNVNNISETRLTYNISLDRQPAWSPDGQWITFTSDRSGNWDIYKMSINGETSALVKLTNYGGFDLEPSWYPNNRILFARGSGQGYEDVYIMNNDGTNVVQLTSETDFDEYADWSPDGGKIVYTSVGGIVGGAKQIWLMNSDGSGKYKLNTEYGIQAAWSPDGTKIAFKCYRPGPNICVMDADGNNIKQLTFETANTHDPDWSPDNQHIVYASQKDGDFEIYAMSTDGSNKTQLTSNIGIEDNYPRWSPDGQNIVFSSNRSGNAEIWVMKVNIGQNLPGLKINSFSPINNPNTAIGIGQAFSITLNKNADVTWSIDGNDIWSQTDVLTSTYINSTTELGIHVVNVVATDGKDIISNEWTWTVVSEPTSPTVVDSSPTDGNISVDTQITVTFSEAMDQSSVESSFSTSPYATGTSNWNNDTMTFIPDTNLAYSITYTVTIGTGAKDIDGDNLQSSYSWSFTTSDESVSPTTTINQGLGQEDPTSVEPINFAVVFSKPVPDFATGDVTLDGTAGATTATVTGSGADYNVAISGMTTSGTVVAFIEAGVAHDEAGNGNTASTSTDNVVNFNIPNNVYIPSTPIITNVTTGNFWVKYTIQPGIGDNVTDSFNINANGVQTNGTIENEINITVGPHGTGDIIVYAYNNSGGLSLNPAVQSMQIPNNVPIMQTRIGDRNVSIGTELTFTVSSIDADGDPITYNTSATKGSLDSTTGIYSWIPDNIDVGTYIWSFCSNDNYGGVTCEVINIIVGGVSPLTTNITEPQQNAIVQYIDNIVKGEITGGNIRSAILNIKTGQNIVSSYNLTDLVNTNTKFIQRVEYVPNKINTLELIATDISGNSSKISRVVTIGDNILQSIIDVNAGESLTIDAINETGAEIIFASNVTRTVTFKLIATTNITEINELNNTIFTIGERDLGRIIDINVDGINISDITEIQNITIKLYYTNKDLDIDGDGTVEIGELDENKMFFYWYDSENNSWKKLSNGNPQWVIDSGITKITDNNPGYIWLKARHLSRYGLTAGLLQLEKDTYTGSSGSGGGGGGGGTSGENYSNIEFKERKELDIYKDMVTRYIFTDQRNPIMFVNITGNASVGETAVTVEVLKNISSLLKIPSPGFVYRNINIWLGTSGFVTSKNIKSATISFRVENSWLDTNSMRDNIKLTGWNGNEWVSLETSKMKKDYNYTYFDANTDNFSHFAITGLKVGNPEQVIGPKITGDKPKTRQMATKTPNPKETSGFEAIIGLITLSIYIFWLKRKK